MIMADTVLETAHGSLAVRLHQDGNAPQCLSIATGDLTQPGVAVRMHSSCVFGEALFATDCDCGQQLSAAMQEIQRRGSGVVVYLYQEGRGAGLAAKIQGMEHQRTFGVNSYESYAALGIPRDDRDYSPALGALEDLQVCHDIALMSNNPLKQEALEKAGYQVREHVFLVYELDRRAYEYLMMKKREGSHALDLDRIRFVG